MGVDKRQKTKDKRQKEIAGINSPFEVGKGDVKGENSGMG
jgi:hypothetical protein